MTENEAIKGLETSIDLAKMCTQNYERKREIQCYEMAINALKEIQKYRTIGTPEECRAAMEKQKEKNPIRLDKCTCPSCGTYNEVWKKRRNTLPSDIVYCWHCGQAVEIFREASDGKIN